MKLDAKSLRVTQAELWNIAGALDRHPQEICRAVCGGNKVAGQMLWELMFWWTKSTRADGLVYKSWRDWSSALGVSEATVHRAKKKLKEAGLEIVIKKANGDPTTHYGKGTVAQKISEVVAEMGQSDSQDDSTQNDRNPPRKMPETLTVKPTDKQQNRAPQVVSASAAEAATTIQKREEKTQKPAESETGEYNISQENDPKHQTGEQYELNRPEAGYTPLPPVPRSPLPNNPQIDKRRMELQSAGLVGAPVLELARAYTYLRIKQVVTAARTGGHDPGWIVAALRGGWDIRTPAARRESKRSRPAAPADWSTAHEKLKASGFANIIET